MNMYNKAIKLILRNNMKKPKFLEVETLILTHWTLMSIHTFGTAPHLHGFYYEARQMNSHYHEHEKMKYNEYENRKVRINTIY